MPRSWSKPLRAREFVSALASGEIPWSANGSYAAFTTMRPLFVRPFALFFYRYFLRLGFLDGREGFIFWTLQTFWFRFLIDAKLFEQDKSKSV